ncbi:hypothetical protein GALMADRAFT_463306 [Galerina marginata CBS 339.88]|uniref:Cytochrome P450 n=1 Tax=Galerina marginata (strain CBS 339.88) TaxID=685588 RepID=A0A067SZ40_GALM3|nr:hypothetical protein GALMADRAFT_463306 [Galerina marginata CBS 339.88]
MILAFFQSFFLLVVPWVCWRLIRRRLFPTVLDNVPGPKARSWVAGSLNELVNANAWEYHQKIAETYGAVTRVKGTFGADNLYVFDPKALHHILIKDLHIYGETEAFCAASKMIFGETLTNTHGERHRQRRKTLNPSFSSSQLREMEPIFYQIAHKVQRLFIKKAQHGPQEVDVQKWMQRLTLEVIGQAGLGYSFDELTEESVRHEYALAAHKLATMPSSIVVSETLIPLITKIGTPRFRRFVVDILPFKRIRFLRDIVDTLHRTSMGILKSKRQAIREGDSAVKAQVGGGQDIMSVMMRHNMLASEDERWSEEELVGQITAFTFGGTDTTSATLTRTLYLLALHKDVQEKVREEVRKARKENGGQDIGHDVLVSLPYLDAICKETLRLHPPISTLIRVYVEYRILLILLTFVSYRAQQDVVLPVGTPIKGLHGEQIQEVPLPKGTLIIMSIFNANRNPKIWGPDAQEWIPERWLSPLPDSVVNGNIPGVYSHLLTFIAGGRACIGFRFAQFEMKVILALLLESLEFSVSDKKIFWQMNGIVTPNLHPNIIDPTLPMVIRLAK